MENLNPWLIARGDIVTSETFTGIYRVHDIERKETDGIVTLVAQCYQLFTMDGKAVKLNRPAYADVRVLKLAFLQIPALQERIQHLQTLVDYLENLKETNKL